MTGGKSQQARVLEDVMKQLDAWNARCEANHEKNMQALREAREDFERAVAELRG